MKYDFLPRDPAGRRVRIARDSFSLCWAWNAATAPFIARSSHEHKRAAQYARAIMRRVPAYAYREWSDGRRTAVVLVLAPRPACPNRLGAAALRAQEA